MTGGRRLALFCALAMLASATGGAKALTLSEAIATAYETNPELLAARANLRGADERVNQARAGLRPRVDGFIDYGVRHSDGKNINSDSNDEWRIGLDATQPLYDGGRTQNSVRARISDVSAARARLAALEQVVTFDVVTAYLDILAEQEFVRLADNNVRVIAEQLRAAQDRFEVGEVTRTDVSQAEARLAESSANLSIAQGRLDNARQAFRSVVGSEPLNLSIPQSLPPLPQSMEEAVTLALENHPLSIAARFDEESAARDIRVQMGDLLPTVSLQAGVDYGDSIFDTTRGGRPDADTTAVVSLRADVPLYQGGAEYSRIREAQALASAARADLTTVARERRQVAEAAWTELQVARANIRANRERVDAAQLAFEGVREEANVGSRTTLDVLDAEQELLDARVRLVASIRDESVAAYGLLSAIGALTTAELQTPVDVYDPDENYAVNNARFIGFERTEDTVWEEIWRP
jgi:outer membrane protein